MDETKTYPKLARPRDCAAQAKSLKKMCDHGTLRPPATPSLEAACIEYQRLAAAGAGI